jgi:hypothetical protein
MAIVKWILLNGVSILGMVQVVIKFVKELLTLVVNVLFPVFWVNEGSFEKTVLKVRAMVETLDGWVEKLKAAMLSVK